MELPKKEKGYYSMRNTALKLLLVTIVAVHYILFTILVASIPVMVVMAPWYIGIPLATWVINLPLLPVRCPLTTAENVVRVKLGLPKINGFVSKHILFRDK